MLKNLKLLRNQKKLSQKQLAEIIGVSQQSINKYENHNIEPDINTLIQLANYFSTSVDYLIGNTEITNIIESVEPFNLNDDEADLINKYRLLDKDEKKAVKSMTDFIIKKYKN